jgi:hypothetical protein
VISILVTLFSSLGTLLLDYLFIDILSAPTAESDDDSPVPVSLSPSLSPSPSQVRVRVTRAKSTLKLDNEVRVVPRGLVTAHSEAALSFGQIMSGSEDRLKTEVTHRNSIRMKRLTGFKSANPDLKNSLPSQSIKEVAPAPSQFPLQPSGDLLLQSLFDDLEEERRKLKRESEKESFDSLWGYVMLLTSLPSLSSSVNRIQSSSSDDVIWRVSDEQKEIMKRELVYVLDETSKKVKKLRSATDIQIGPPLSSTPFHRLLTQLCLLQEWRSSISSFWISWEGIRAILMLFLSLTISSQRHTSCEDLSNEIRRRLSSLNGCDELVQRLDLGRSGASQLGHDLLHNAPWTPTRIPLAGTDQNPSCLSPSFF